MQKEIEELQAKIKQWDQEYYGENNPSVPDTIYDQAFQRLQQLEKDAATIQMGSPTQSVARYTITHLEKVKHQVPMLSIRTEVDTSIQGAIEFIKRIQKELNTTDPVIYIAEPKYDGLAISLTYQNGILQRAVTRGDGQEGEDVTENTCLINQLPLHIGHHTLEVRGEVWMGKEIFEDWNETLKAGQKEPFKNPRNAAAGLLRRSHKQTLPKLLSFTPYQLISHQEITSQSQALEFLANLGFSVPPEIALAQTAEDLQAFHEFIELKRKDLDYGIDGVVYKVNDFSLQKQLGFNNREPRWAIAHKYQPEVAYTKINQIIVQTGRTGRVTPVALVEPVNIGGVTVSRVTLNNLFDMRKLKLREGDVVVIQRAGDVIPEITQRLSKKEGPVSNFKFPSHCDCGSPIKRAPGSRYYHCTGGRNCHYQLQTALEHFASKLGMDIHGFGPEISAFFVERFPKLTFATLYDKEKINRSSLCPLGEKTAAKLLASIEKSKDVQVHKFLYALGIPEVGEATAKILAGHFKGLEGLPNASKEYLLDIEDIGPQVATNVSEFFSNQENKLMILELLTFGVKPVYIKSLETGRLQGLKIAITGTLAHHKRSEMQDLITQHGGIVVNSITKDTNFLVYGENAGSKLEAAISKEVNTLTEDEFILLVKGE